ncbi:MAG TPA: OmpA family protein [Gemmatimonadales bacterium]|nr:OmpA family protein [Gemmatimonadales bacterium]
MNSRLPLAGLALLALAITPSPAHPQLPGIQKVRDEAGKLKPPAESPAQPAPSAPASVAGDTTRPAARTDPKVWENYDFIPGNRVIFFTDFSEDRVGNFARGLTYRAGAMDVVDRDGVKLLRATNRSQFLIPVGKRLPERFTLEFDILAPEAELGGYDVFAFEGGADLDRSEASAEVNWNPGGTLIIGGGQTAGSSDAKVPEPMLPALRGQVAHVRVLMDSAYFKLYVNERRMYNIPELGFRRDSVIRVFLRGSEEPGLALYLARIRVAESETDVLYDALVAKGRWATQGILFATGKADLQPESRPVLKEIATTLQQHGDLRILVEGHTDNVGSAAGNLALSDARAAAVKAALVGQFGIAADRITTKGLGDTAPAVPNTTAAGRAQNRRVEVVKL